ncbi:hypothetical protein AHF37_00625 [Paragonimus kellicotti]|nr:hypothetical protein AHF37_00625 [Paragonimus kellicotti]
MFGASGLSSLLQAHRRNYHLQFHKVHVAPRSTRIVLITLSCMVPPACIWAFFYVRHNEHLRKEKEKTAGPRYYRRNPRYIRPLPWGDGKTPFYAAMCQYWGFEVPEYLRKKEE